MKNLKFNLLFIALLFSLMSCKKDVIADIIEFSNEEAAEIITSAIQTNTEGLVAEISDMSNNIVDNISNNYECNVAVDSSFSHSGSIGQISNNYDINWTWLPHCNNFGVMTSLDYSSQSTGSHTSNKLTSNDSGNTTFVITGTNPTSESLDFVGSFSRNGNQTLTVKNTRTVQSDLDLVITSISVSKDDEMEIMGDASFTMTVITEGETFNFTGTIVFISGDSATIIINGETFNIIL